MKLGEMSYPRKVSSGGAFLIMGAANAGTAKCSLATRLRKEEI